MQVLLIFPFVINFMMVTSVSRFVIFPPKLLNYLNTGAQNTLAPFFYFFRSLFL